MSKLKKHDRRQWVREVLAGVCKFTIGNMTYSGKLRDISVGGCFIEMPYDHRIDINNPCILTVTTMYGSFDSQSRVVREGEGGYGLFFCSMDESSKDIFKDIIKSLRLHVV